MPVTRAATPIPSVGSGATGSDRRSRVLALRATAMLVVSAVVGATVSLLSSGAPQTSGGTGEAPLTEVHAVPTAEAASFAVLRRPLRPTDAFVALHRGSGPLGANPALARTLSEPKGELSAGTVSIVPANGSVCLRVPFTEGGAQWWCQPLRVARMGKLVTALRPAGSLRASEQLLVGLVPDGVKHVTVSTADGTRRSLPVRSNVYDAQIFAPRTISIDLPSVGVRSYPAP
jgi:hypothetical protein